MNSTSTMLILMLIFGVEVTEIVLVNVVSMEAYIEIYGIRGGIEMYRLLGTSNVENGLVGALQAEREAESGSNTIIPDKAIDIANQVKAKNGAAPKGYRGGKVYQNMSKEGAQKLAEGISYKEYDINPYVKGQNRGMERIVIGDDGSVWYTNNHYETFTRIK